MRVVKLPGINIFPPTQPNIKAKKSLHRIRKKSPKQTSKRENSSFSSQCILEASASKQIVLVAAGLIIKVLSDVKLHNFYLKNGS